MQLQRLLMLWRQHASYWYALPYKKIAQKKWSRLIRDLSNKGIAARDSSSRIRDLFKRTNYDLIRVVVVTSGLYFADVLLLSDYYSKALSISADSYTDILLSIAGLTGVFIGLYYAALSAIGSTLYSQFPVSIRTLLKEERSGATYMRFLSWLGFGCITLAMIRVLGGQPSLLGLMFAVLFAAVAIFGFAFLGRSVFDFFDPSTLSYEVYTSMQRQIRRVATGVNNPSRHATYMSAHVAALNSLTALDEIRSIIAPRAHLKDSYIQLVSNAIRLSILYSQQKQKIHPQSSWYPQEHRFEDWYKTGDSTTSLHVRTGTFTYPKYYANSDWVEKRINPIVFQCVSDSIGNGIKQDTSRLFLECLSYVRHRAYQGEVEDALRLADHVLNSFATQTIKSEASDNDQEWVLLSDTACSFYVETLTHYRAWHVDRIKHELVEITRLPWGSHSILKRAPPSARYTSLILEINEQAAFEQEVEGRVVTPTWFIDERFRTLICSRIASQIPLLIQAPSAILDVARNLISSKRPYSALAIYSRLLEYMTKIEGYLDEFEKISVDLNESKNIKGLVWLKTDYEDSRKAVKEARMKLLITMASYAKAMPSHSPDSKVPDYAGQFLDTLGHELLDSLWSKDSQAFVQLYKDFFLGSIVKYQNLISKEEFPEHMQMSMIGLAISPIVDAMEIAGIGVIIAQAFDLADIETCIRETWNDFLSDAETSEARKRLIVTAAQFSMAPMNPVSREITRTGWRREMLNVLGELPRKTVNVSGRGLIRPSYTTVDHAVPLVRVVANDSVGISTTGLNIFCVEILRDIPEQLGVEIGYQNDDLKERLRRAERRSGGDDD
jgi:hypothetical protein